MLDVTYVPNGRQGKMTDLYRDNRHTGGREVRVDFGHGLVWVPIELVKPIPPAADTDIDRYGVDVAHLATLDDLSPDETST